ncbi:MAG TPA: hypothetical protein VFW74_17470 [Acidimicrobiia bacterium]|nr:hypothetical protein [Acidimicrobiia bacterium]
MTRRGLLRTIAVATLVLVVATACAAWGAGGATPDATAATTAQASPVRRILVLSLPTVSCADVRDARMPNLRRLLVDSAIADLSTRSVHPHTTPGDGYATIGAGTRVVGVPGADGLALEPGERFGSGTAADAYTRRTSHAPDAGVITLGMPQIESRNSRLLFDARPGALADALHRDGWHTAVVANADEPGPEPPSLVLHREAALALADGAGRDDGGAVDESLLARSTSAPFGVRMSRTAVTRAFDDVWKDRSVVLVEASDLARADAARAVLGPWARGATRTDALQRADDLAGALLQHVDPRHDAVLVVGPYHPAGQLALTVAALRAPGVDRGMLRSSTTRRDGFVQIVDVAPTVLRLAGVAQPESMEGRPMVARETGGTLATRISYLADANGAARFRDATLGTAAAVFVALSMILAALTLLALATRAAAARGALEAAALGLVGFLVATYLAPALGFGARGSVAFWVFVVGTAALFSAACLAFGRRGALVPLVLALGALVVLHVGDALSGAHLELNAVFGYTPTVGIRLAGLGNMAYSQLTTAALLLAGLVAWRWRSRRGFAFACGLLVAVLVVVAAPFWGQNFGGSLAAAPVFALAVILLSGRTPNVRTVVGLGALAVVTGVVIGFVDLARPAASRTHVGRFFEQVGNEGWHGFTLVIHRKADESLATFGHSVWTPMTLGILVFLALLAWSAPRWLDAIEARVPTLRAVLVALLVLLVLGVALKDSGIAVPGMMLGVANAALVFLAARFALRPSPR